MNTSSPIRRTTTRRRPRLYLAPQRRERRTAAPKTGTMRMRVRRNVTSVTTPITPSLIRVNFATPARTKALTITRPRAVIRAVILKGDILIGRKSGVVGVGGIPMPREGKTVFLMISPRPSAVAAVAAVAWRSPWAAALRTWPPAAATRLGAAEAARRRGAAAL